MEIDKAMTEETAQASSEAQTSPPKTATARSYECIYCKRGFSNAQALGGHMNIHRKDRQAKLKHPAKQSHQFPFNISAKVVPPFSPSLMGHAPMPQQLALLVEGPGRGDDHRGSVSPVSPGPVMVEELDLELRLGPERPDHASSMGLRQFL